MNRLTFTTAKVSGSIRCAIGLLLGLLLIPAPAPAPAQGLIGFSEASQEIIQQIAQRMNAITTMDAEFTQYYQQTLQTGKLIIARPDKFRIEYNETGNILLSNGVIISFVDQELQEVQQAFIKGTIAEFLIKPNWDFNDGIRVLSVVKEPTIIKLRIVLTEGSIETNNDFETSDIIELTFSDQDYLLQAWQYTDALDQNVRFVIHDPVFGNQHLGKEFVFFPPEAWN